jgi:ABC-type transporter lipoprotein component MlaA
LLEPLGRAAFSLVNEPVSVVRELVSGDAARAWEHVQHFAINAMRGLGGIIDRAQERGPEPLVTDPGLALGRGGVPPDRSSWSRCPGLARCATRWRTWCWSTSSCW